MSDLQQRIRERAYQLWEQAGCPHEHTETFWHAAQAEIEGAAPEAGDAPDEAIDHPPAEQTLEDPPAAEVQRGEAAGMPGERIAEAGVQDERLIDMATPRPSAAPASSAPAKTASTQTTRKAASMEEQPTPTRTKPAPRSGRR